MSRLRLTKIATPSTPGANLGDIYYSSTFNPVGMAWIDENGTVRRLSPATVKITADLAATTSTTLADSTGLVFAVTSGLYYQIHFDIVWTTATATTGLKLGFTCPTTTILAAEARVMGIAAAGTAAEFLGHITASGGSVTGTATAAPTATPILASLDIMILPSANGNVQVQHAAAVASAGNVVVKQGSNGYLREVF